MTLQRQAIADYVRRRIAVGRVQPHREYSYAGLLFTSCYGGQLPTALQIADELSGDGEFRALGLGGLLHTATAELLTEAVELVVPSALQPEFDIIVAAFRIAASRQQGESWAKAAATAGIGLVVTGVIAALIDGRGARS